MIRNSTFDSIFENSHFTTLALKKSNEAEQILLIAKKDSKAILFVNSYSLYLANRNKNYSNIIESSICLLDGRPLWKIVSLLSERRVHHVRGLDFFKLVLESPLNKTTSQVLLGSTEQNCLSISEKVITLGGSRVQYICPPQQSLEDFDFDSLATQLAALSPDIVWVGLGTPKQDFVAHELASRLDSTIVAVGAAFDFYSGTKKQAPRWIQATYLEWLFRLLSEPKRLWKRYLIGNIGFVSDIALWVLSARKRQS